MPLYEKIQERFYEDSDRSSSGIRNLALSGVVALWVVSNSHNDPTSYFAQNPGMFRLAALCFVLALTLDLMHYYLSSFFLWKLVEKLRIDFKDDQETLFTKEHDLTNTIIRFPWFFYIAKGSVLIIGGFAFVRALSTIK